MLALEGDQNQAGEAISALTQYETSRTATKERAKSALAISQRDVWKCDPPRGHSSSNGTYDQLIQLLQGHIENEKDMNDRSNCMQNCDYYGYTTAKGCYHGYCKTQKRACRGKLLECKYVASDMTVCEAASNSIRRYEYIEYDNSRTFGRNAGCPNARTVRVESWWRWIFWHCSYCMCLCDDAASSKTDRYWSLHPVMSDSAHDMVVTGIRLVKNARMVHLQIQQARLAPRGRVDPRTVEWRPVEPLHIDKFHIKEGRDYHTMSYEKRELDLDDVIVPTSHIVTGVKWRMVGAHLNLEVLAAPVNWTAGHLIRPQEKSFWVSSDLTLARQKVVIIDPDLPTRQTQPSQVDSHSDMYVEFTNSDMEKDAGQSTVPYLDTQIVSNEPPAPLSGVGLYHKGQRGYGGYVGPKVITYDYVPHMRD